MKTIEQVRKYIIHIQHKYKMESINDNEFPRIKDNLKSLINELDKILDFIDSE